MSLWMLAIALTVPSFLLGYFISYLVMTVGIKQDK
jgi:hypothetical protein